MEGVAGVVMTAHVSRDHKEYERFRKLMTAEANAAIEGALAGGAKQVIVNDSHGGAANILIEELNPAATLISGNPRPFGMIQGISSDINAVFFVGYHGASGTATATLAHTVTGEVVEVCLNGRLVGETGINAAMAGVYGTPVVLVTGDKAVTEEARALLGNIETVAVKEAVTQTAAQCLAPKVACRYIREAAERALKLKIAPFVVKPPITLRIVFLRPGSADSVAMLLSGVHRVDGRTVEWTGEDMTSVFRTFRAMIYIMLASRERGS